MMEKNKDTLKTEVKRIGEDMAKLIRHIEKRFADEYGFSPDIVDITNLIAKRVFDSKLF